MKILVSDYDGTLAFGMKVSKEDKEAIKRFQDAGNLFVICTGRSPNHIKKVKELNADYYIISSGAIVNIDDFNEVEYIDEKYTDDLIKTLKSYNDRFLGISGLDYFKLYAKGKELFIQLAFLGRLPDFFRRIDKVVIICDKAKDETEALEKKKYLESKYPVFVSVNGSFMDITSNKVNKVKAVNKLKDLYKDSKIYTIGDGLNDVEMLEEFNGACMANSSLRVKRKIKKVYQSVKDYIDDILNDVV